MNTLIELKESENMYNCLWNALIYSIRNLSEIDELIDEYSNYAKNKNVAIEKTKTILDLLKEEEE